MKQRGISLALQGGGSYGAFTWGVLDRLLEDASIEIKGVSGASAGAINATLLAHGLTIGGRQGARRALAEFWGSVAGTLPNSLVESLVFLTRFLSPAQFNPFNLNPVRDLLAEQIDFERLRAALRAADLHLGDQRADRDAAPVPYRARSPPTCCWRRHACRRCTARWRSTARPTGTAA